MIRNFHAGVMHTLPLLLALAAWPATAATTGTPQPGASTAHAVAAASAGHEHGQPARKKAQQPAAPVHLVDINSASRKELMTLPGIGAGEADRIIAGRPYLTKTELVSKQVLPTGPYLTLRKLIVAMQKPRTTATAASKPTPKSS